MQNALKQIIGLLLGWEYSAGYSYLSLNNICKLTSIHGFESGNWPLQKNGDKAAYQSPLSNTVKMVSCAMGMTCSPWFLPGVCQNYMCHK